MKEYQMKTCSYCGIQKSLSEFYNDSKSKDKKQSRCINCTTSNLYIWRDNNKDKVRAQGLRAHYKYKYGISMLERNTLIKKQFNKCAICQKTLKKYNEACVDHCHTSGKIRGILCKFCNSGLGYFLDSQENIKSALKYLKKHQKK